MKLSLVKVVRLEIFIFVFNTCKLSVRTCRTSSFWCLTVWTVFFGLFTTPFQSLAEENVFEGIGNFVFSHYLVLKSSLDEQGPKWQKWSSLSGPLQMTSVRLSCCRSSFTLFAQRVKVNVVLMWFIFIYYNIKSQKQWEQKLSTFPTCTMMSFLSRGLPSGHSSPKHRSISYCGGSAVWPRCWQITPTRQERVNTHIRQWHGCKYIWIQKYEWWKIQSLNCWLFQYNPAVNELINFKKCSD